MPAPPRALFALVLCACAGPQSDTQPPRVAAPGVALERSRSEGPARRPSANEAADECLDAIDERGAAPQSPDAACSDLATCSERCARGEANECRPLAAWFVRRRDARCAEALRELGCEHGDVQACSAVVSAPARRTRLPAGLRRRLEQSCNGGYGAACSSLGGLYRALGNKTAALTRFEQGCRRGHAAGCRDALTLLEQTPHMSEERILGVRAKACDLGDHATCAGLARALAHGIGVEADPARAQRLAADVCRLDQATDEGEACHLLAQLLITRERASAEQTEPLYRRACSKGHVESCGTLALEHYIHGRHEEALALSTTLIARDERHWLPRYTRGMSLFDLGRFAEATRDLAVLCDARDDWLHCRLWLYAARERAGEDGESGLAASVDGLDPREWPMPVARFFLGKLGEAKLLAAARDQDAQKEREQLCEAYYYLGQAHMIRGRRERARDMFRKAVATGITNFVEYAGARAELARMGAAER
jgi:TPR repeat protein